MPFKDAEARKAYYREWSKQWRKENPELVKLRHLVQYLRKGPPKERHEVSVAEKVCTGCKACKPAAEFHRRVASNDGLSPICRECSRAKHHAYYLTHTGENLVRSNKWRREHPEESKDLLIRTYLRQRYGITREDYERMYEAQHGKCALCGRDGSAYVGERPLRVDHDHVTMRIRGLLCHLCNLSLARLGDRPDAIRRVLAYVEEPPT